MSTGIILLIVFGCLFSGCLATCVVLGMKGAEAERACNADPVCKAEKEAKAQKAEEEAKAKKAAKDEKAEQDTKAKAERADQAAKAKEQKTADESAANEKTAALAALPDSEKKFCSTVVAFAKDYKAAPSDNELKRSKVRGDRRQALAALPASVSDWLGTITELSTNGDGKAVLGVKLPCGNDMDVKVKTWNNAVSDTFDHSLIPQSSKTYATLSELGKGKQIRFAGSFVTGDEKNGLRESSLSERGSMTDPEFIFRFSLVGDARTSAPASGSADSSAPVPPTSDFDAVGAEKEWGDIHTTLKEAAVKGNTATATILLKNTQAKEQHISSLMQIQVTNEEGDKGEMDVMNASCDGAVPPNGLLKCKLAYTFPKPPKEVTVALGAGFGASTVYFKFKNGK